MEGNTTFDTIGEVIEQNESFLLISHVSPDGDAIGSILALGHVLENRGKKVYYRNEDGVPSSLSFLPHADAVEKPEDTLLGVDVVFALDCATKPRLGEKVLAQAADAKCFVNIDHHKTNTLYGDLYYIDPSSPATGQIIYDLCKHLDYTITDVARDNLYVAVSTDTGSFRYSNTTSNTYAMASDLLDKGLNVSEVNTSIYEKNPLRKVKLLGEYLTRLTVSEDGKIADWILPMSVKTKLALQSDDSEGMIDHIRSIEGVLVACSFEDLKENKVRISLRSKSDEVDVSAGAQVFGGGGHSRAAGIRLDGPIEEARKKVIAEVQAAVAGVEI